MKAKYISASPTPDIDELYIDTIKGMDDVRDRERFRELVYTLMQQRSRVTPHDIWAEAVTQAVRDSKTWITARERAEILAKIEAGNDEYEEAIASQEAAATIPSR